MFTRQNIIFCTIISTILLMLNGCALLGQTISLEDIQLNIDDYYTKHPTLPDSMRRKIAVERGNATTLMTLTEVKLATSVRKLMNNPYPLNKIYFDESDGGWLADNVTRSAGGVLSWSVDRPKDLGYYGGIINVPEYTYYFKWNDDIGEYICYDWIEW